MSHDVGAFFPVLPPGGADLSIDKPPFPLRDNNTGAGAVNAAAAAESSAVCTLRLTTVPIAQSSSSSVWTTRLLSASSTQTSLS